MKIVPCTGVIDHFVVDDEDYDRVMAHKWNANKSKAHLDGFRIKATKGERPQLRKILFCSTVEKRIKRTFGDKNDYRKECFVFAERNATSQGYKRRDGTASKYTGVYWYKAYSKWRSKISVQGKFKHIGYFTDEREAAAAYNTAALHYFGEHAKLNVLD